MKTILITLLYFYKTTISLLLGRRCRFYPSCSDYAREAIQCYGVTWGTYLAARRLCRCHPFSSGGSDFVQPLPTNEKTSGNPSLCSRIRSTLLR
ncbi:MAG: membrane protein insertion efficiency factor YidD [Burkholderia sp.]|nr:membrane protein insertion efficiency factor YidD [Burkholderia sp.]